ncbi:MAG: hypothetical protein WC865_05395 [Bacteroidales bacterium]
MEARCISSNSETTKAIPVIGVFTTWPHTFITPDFASMAEYKHYAPANHLHMTWNLPAARLQFWMDLANVFSVTPWQAKPSFRENIDRPLPLLYLLNGGENQTKILRKV